MALSPRDYPDPAIDSFTRNVRAVCGALLGVVLALGFWLRCGPLSATQGILALLVSVAACVVGAVRYGDAFWMGVLRLIRHS